MLTSREVMLRVVETLAAAGIREPSRLMRDVRIIHKEIMEQDDDAPKPARGRPKADANA